MSQAAEPRRMTLDEVKNWSAAEGPLIFIDARSEQDYRTSPVKLPGAHRLPPGDDEPLRGGIPQAARQIAVVSCSCPDEKSSLEVASRMPPDGWADAHPLIGGFAAWAGGGMPVEPK